MNRAVLVTLSLIIIATPVSAKSKRPPPEGPGTPTAIYMVNSSQDIPANGWGGHWNQDVFNACVNLLRAHVDSVATFYHPQGVNLIIADTSKASQGWSATFKYLGSANGFHSISSSGYPMAVAYTEVLNGNMSPCTVMGEEIAEMLGNSRPGSICLTTSHGNRIEPEITDPVWGSDYCPRGYEPECSDTVAGPVPGFVLPAWFANKHGVAGLSAEMTFPTNVVSKPWQRTKGGAYYPCY